MVKYIQAIQTIQTHSNNCLSVFEMFVGLALKELISSKINKALIGIHFIMTQ